MNTRLLGIVGRLKAPRIFVLGDLILARLNTEGYHEQSRTNIIAPRERSPIWAHPAYMGTRVFARNDTEIVCVQLPVEK